MEKLLTRKEAAKLLGISIDTLDAARTNGQVSFVQYVENGCVYFTEQSLQEFIARSTAQGKAKGSQYRHDLQNAENSGTKVTSLIQGLES